MKEPVITRDCVHPVCDKRFIRVYDLEYAPGRHYYDASRRLTDDLVALKTPEEAKTMLPDAVSCVVVLCCPGQEPRLLLSWEYRYCAGRFLLSVPAGIIDPEDRNRPDALEATAIREIREETGLEVQPEDTVRPVSPFVYSTPGMSDESNALMSVVLHPADFSGLNQDGAEGSECFDGFSLLTVKQAEALLKSGRDQHGDFYSLYTWAALMWFVSGMWREEA